MTTATSNEITALNKAVGVDHSDIKNLNELKRRAKLRYGQRSQPYLTVMANKYRISYFNLSHVLNARSTTSSIISAIQKDFNLTDEQVLACWPLLRRWPRPDLEERAMRRAG